MVIEDTKFHAIASATSGIHHDFLVDILGFNRIAVVFVVVKGEVLVWNGSDCVDMKLGEEVRVFFWGVGTCVAV